MIDASERFAALQRRVHDLPPTGLAELGQDDPVTVIGLPSIDFGNAFAARSDVAALESRWLYLLLLLRRPHARVAIVTSEPVEEAIVDYYLGLAGAKWDTRDRLALFTVSDLSPRPLAVKLLEHTEVLAAIRGFVAGEAAFIHPFCALDQHDRDLALALDVPILGLDARFARYATKSGSRQLLAASGVPVPAGAEDLHGAGDVGRAIVALRRADGELPAVVVKLDDGVTGSGNEVVALQRLPPNDSLAERRALKDRLGALDRDYVAALAGGAIVEQQIDATSSPSVQVRIDPGGSVDVLSVHDQLLGGPHGHSYAGCRFPASEADAAPLIAHGLAVGRRLAAEGAVGRFAVDFVVDGRGDAFAVEINPREGATTHPHGTLVLLESGARFLRASDAITTPAARTWRDAVAAVDDAGLGWQQERSWGVVLYMLNGVERAGRVSAVALGTTAEQAETLFDATVEVLKLPRAVVR